MVWRIGVERGGLLAERASGADTVSADVPWRNVTCLMKNARLDIVLSAACSISSTMRHVILELSNTTLVILNL